MASGKIRIEWLSDYTDCETCGGSYAEGAIVELNDELFLSLEPRAHCFDGDSWDRQTVFQMILEKLGYETEIVEQ